MLGAVFSEMDEDWSSRRWFIEDSIAKAVEGHGCKAPAPGYVGSAGEHAKRIIDLVLADSQIDRKAA